MRGPNKVKRKSVAVSNAASRRASVVSSASSVSDDAASSSGSSKKSVGAASKSSIDTSAPGSVPSPTTSASPTSDASQQLPGSSRLQKLRPPSLNLKRTSMFDLQSQFLSNANALAKMQEQHLDDESPSARRPSLPSYLIESYARIAQDSLGGSAQPAERPYSPQPLGASHPSEPVPSIEDRLRALGYQSMSTPITPISVTPSSNFCLNLADYIHPQYVEGMDDAHAAAVESHYVAGSHDESNGLAWSDVMMDSDPTPTAGLNGVEKNLTQVESKMLVSEA